MIAFINRWSQVFLWCSLIFFLSSQPHLPGPQDQTMDFIVKKIGHLTVYGVLFHLVFVAYGKKTPFRIFKTFLFCILYAMSDEYHQSFVPGRTPLLTDIGIDTLGMLVSFFFLRYREVYAKKAAI